MEKKEGALILLKPNPFFTQELGFCFFNMEVQGVHDSCKKNQCKLNVVTQLISWAHTQPKS